MNKTPTIALDVDDVCLGLIDNWLALYNRDWNDNLTREHLTDFNISLFVKPECGQRIYEYIETPTVYDGVKPLPGALEGVKWLRSMGWRIVYATTARFGHAGVKYKKLQEFGFVDRLEDYMEIADKSLINADILIDDRWDNVKNFPFFSILFRQPWNEKYNYLYSVRTWDDVIGMFNSLQIANSEND